MRSERVGTAQAGAEVVRIGDAVVHEQQCRLGEILQYVVERSMRRASGATSVPGAETVAPSKRIAPCCTVSKPAMQRSTVVLPQPLGPSRQKSSPRSISRDRPLSTRGCSPARPGKPKSMSPNRMYAARAYRSVCPGATALSSEASTSSLQNLSMSGMLTPPLPTIQRVLALYSLMLARLSSTT